jgi:VPDSG-CTERM motif
MRLRMHCKVLGLTCLAALAITPAWADLVTYSTTGVFSSTGTNVYSGNNGLTITYGDTVNNTAAVPPPSNVSFGTFTVAGPLTGYTDSISENFALTITQTTPSMGSETLTDTFTGAIKINSSNVELTFTGGSPLTPVLTTDPGDHASAYEFQLGTIDYWVDKYTSINPSTTNGGVSTINGAISTVPDGGATLMLLGGVLVGLESLRRRLRV